MDNHKNLYKTQRSYNPRENNKINRELLKANRCRQRRERFHDTRHLSPSPICHKKEVIIPLCPDDRENVNNNLGQQQDSNNTRTAKLVCNANNPEKLTKQAAFLKRFVEWKENKKNMKKQDVYKKKPFVTVVNSSRQTRTSSSLVPRDHHTDFRPPAGLKNPMDNDKVDKNSDVRGRQSVYTVVPTPPKRQPDEKCKFPIVRKALPTNSQKMSSNKTPLGTKKLAGIVSKPMTANKMHDKTQKSIFKSPATKSAAKVAAVNLAKTLDKNKTTAIGNSSKPLLRKGLRPRVLKMPNPPSSTRTAAAGPNSHMGAVGKIRMVTQKRIETYRQTKKSPLKRGEARLAQNLKAKKTLNTSKKLNVPALQMNGKKLLNLLKNEQPIEDVVIQTPRDFATSNPFDEFVTSTRIKNPSQIAGVVERMETMHSTSSAKRNIMKDAANTTLVKESGQTENKAIQEDGLQNVIKKFNFIRYSEAADCQNDNDEMKVKEEEINALDNVENDAEHSPEIEEKTPTKFGPEERPANYLSPFVSVARGKVSLKKENKKRNSVYLVNDAESRDLFEGSTRHNSSAKYSVEIRRTLEAVRYFRKQLQDEIDRLHRLSDVWETYKKENLEKIQNANGEDMINVTIGQTRLLTSKKFMQFKGLIDRCEAGATGIGAVEYDGSEDTKPITSVDLEGFWSMLRLQVDNLDKRFENLNRWKLNNWNDPDEVKPKIKSNLTKIKKSKAANVAKAKPNTALQQMLRKMQAEMRKNKNKGDIITGDVVVTPSKLEQKYPENSANTTTHKSVNTSASRRLSIVVRDRKYFSPAATVISVSSPNCGTNKPKLSQSSPKITKHIQKLNEAFDSMKLSLGLRKSVLLNENSRRISLNQQSPMIGNKSNDLKSSLDPAAASNKENGILGGDTKSHYNSPLPTGRKSILKTPGTAKSRLRNVIFNEKLRVKKFNFLINKDDNPFDAENADNTHEEDLAKSSEEDPKSNDTPGRTLTLRTRSVRLRPSCEILIPQ